MTKLFTKYNKRNEYLVVDEEGNVVSKFRLKLNAVEFVRKNEGFYKKLEIIENENI